MFNIIKILVFLTVFIFIPWMGVNCQSVHPNLVLTAKDVNNIRPQYKNVPLFYRSLLKAQDKLDKSLQNPIDVPIPKDAGGGYTHEKHKQNYNEMYIAGILYQLTGQNKYMVFIKEMLNKYAVLYPTLSNHPQGKKQTPGRLFWQSLNETVWLLHTIQAYDCIYNDLTTTERAYYEDNIFNPMVEFFINDCRHELDLIHNHGTWIVAAVGMAGFVLDNKDYVNKALYGYDEKGNSGFLAQLRELFSPDGYYTEGGYYARYALWPFFIFAESIKNNLPQLNIYKYRDNILEKAFNSVLQVTYTNGAFIPINDALKDKTWLTPELIFASNFTYANYRNDKRLLNLVKLDNQVSLSGPGFKVAQDLQNISDIPNFEWKSVEYTDGPKGDQGGITILRNGSSSDQETMFFKYGSHGLSHGHFDKLSILFYDQGREILQDYGAARFLNIEQKDGGRYLAENNSYAKQTIAHNTLVVDEKSQFNGKRKVSQKYHSEKYAVDYSNPDFQYASAIEKNAYEGVKLHRTICMVDDSILSKPILIDILNVKSDIEHQYDLPFYYKGHFLSLNSDYKAFTTTKKNMGDANGYQHLWKEAFATPDSTTNFTWINGRRFYSIITNTNSSSEIYLTRIGASDPNFNLRNEPGLLIRQRAKSYCFVSVLEPHGNYDPIYEKTVGAYSKITEIKVLQSSDQYSVVRIRGKHNINWMVFISNNDAQKASTHNIKINNKLYSWVGPVTVRKY